MAKPLSRYLLRGLLGVGALIAGVGFASTDWGAAFGAAPEGERLARIEGSPQRRAGVFVNTYPTTVAKAGFWKTLGAFVFNQEQTTPLKPLPMVKDTAARLASPPVQGLRVTWLGHSTTLIEIEGTRLLTDPVWSDRASPSTLLGPKRFHETPLALNAVGKLDAVLISHDHYDHLDMDAVRALSTRGVRFIVPLGVGAHLESWGVAHPQITELEWWQEVELARVRVISTPAQHFSGRALLDRNRTLWQSFAIVGARQRVFFSGDTGLTPEFEQVGNKLGPFDLAMFEIGAYNEAWGDIHLGPHNALEAHRMVRGRTLLPVHWGSFNLALHAWSEPAETLWREARARDVRLVSPLLGQPFEPSSEAPSRPWWRPEEH